MLSVTHISNYSYIIKKHFSFIILANIKYQSMVEHIQQAA